MTGPILRCNTRVELTVTEFLRLDRMPRAKHAVPARLHCELEHQHDGNHVAFAQAGESAYSDTAEWWIRWNGAAHVRTCPFLCGPRGPPGSSPSG